MHVANVILNMFTSLVFTLMAFAFIGYFAESTQTWIDVGLLVEQGSLLGLHKMHWIVIVFLNVFFIGVYIYIWGKSVLAKFSGAVLWLAAGIAVLFLLWPLQRTVSGSYIEWGHFALMGGFVIGAIVIVAQAYLQALNEQIKKQKLESGNVARS